MDGKTLENAIVLEKARSISEQSKMIHITLKNLNLNELDHKVIKRNGQLYHKSKTQQGSLFFKLNINLPMFG